MPPQGVNIASDFATAPLREKSRQSALATRRAVRRREQDDQRTAQREQAIARLDHLSKEEIRYVADSLRDGSPTFYTYVYSPPVTMMVGKGLVWTPGGTHNQDYYPFSFHDWVWEELLGRRDEFLAKDEERKRAEKAEKDGRLRGR